MEGARLLGEDRRPSCCLILTLVSLGVAAILASPARAIDDMQDQQTIAELLETPPVPPAEEAPELQERRWGLLPELGYGPETGAKGGLKFQDRNILDLGADLDVHGSYATKKQTSFTLELGTPHLLDDRALAFLRLHYDYDPQLRFFSLGNNNVGPDVASTNSFERIDGSFVVGWRPWKKLALNLGIDLLHVHVGRGDQRDNTPFTVDAFPNMPGISGGLVNPVSLSLVWTTRDSVVRPQEGWRLILVAAHTNKTMLSDFEFTRVVGDVSYLIPLFGGRHVLGLRANGGYITGPNGSVPYWQLEELGGDDTLRGFFPRRFLGWSRVLGSVEYRAGVYAFDFFSLWHVQVDAAVFGEAGRVFISAKDLRDDFGFTPEQAGNLVSHLQFSYGTGLRFELSEAIVARLDAGFSNEEHGLVYLTFGHTF
jgi:outer membrane protein assembly factor BamA